MDSRRLTPEQAQNIWEIANARLSPTGNYVYLGMSGPEYFFAPRLFNVGAVPRLSEIALDCIRSFAQKMNALYGNLNSSKGEAHDE
jgi:hypothetical protein